MPQDNAGRAGQWTVVFLIQGARYPDNLEQMTGR